MNKILLSVAVLALLEDLQNMRSDMKYLGNERIYEQMIIGSQVDFLCQGQCFWSGAQWSAPVPTEVATVFVKGRVSPLLSPPAVVVKFQQWAEILSFFKFTVCTLCFSTSLMRISSLELAKLCHWGVWFRFHTYTFFLTKIVSQLFVADLLSFLSKV